MVPGRRLLAAFRASNARPNTSPEHRAISGIRRLLQRGGPRLDGHQEVVGRQQRSDASPGLPRARFPTLLRHGGKKRWRCPRRRCAVWAKSGKIARSVGTARGAYSTRRWMPLCCIWLCHRRALRALRAVHLHLLQPWAASPRRPARGCDCAALATLNSRLLPTTLARGPPENRNRANNAGGQTGTL